MQPDGLPRPPANGFHHPVNVTNALRTPTVIGLYGISGAGKTFLLNHLKRELGLELFEYFEGSDVIQSLVPGGLDAFHQLGEVAKTRVRQRAIDSIKSKCAESGKTGIVTGHFMFWPEEAEEESRGVRVCTTNDLDTYTHVLYLNTPAEVIAQRCLKDSQKQRRSSSLQRLGRWQMVEMEELRELCRHHNILFSTVYPNLIGKLSELIRDFQRHSEDHNLSVAERYLDEAISTEYDKLETVLFIDADKTLTAEDTGALFWNKLTQAEGKDSPLKALFGSQLGYSYTAFRQAMLLYEETTNDPGFEAVCEDVALQTAVYPEFVTLLRLVGRYHHICPVIVTCGLRRIWEKIITTEGLSTTVKILGGGRITDKFVVTPSVKRALVTRAQRTHRAYVWAFGDSPLDLPMMAEADEAIVVVGETESRSKSMDRELLAAIDQDGLRARQALLPSNCPVRLDTARLPVVDLTGDGLVRLVLQHRNPPGGLQVVDATNSNAARLLTTPMRDADIRGPHLRDAHVEAGAFLARQYVSEIIGLEELTMRHVQDYSTTGHRLLGEKKTLIVALMRGGEPMALGVNKVFKEAMFLHASQPDDIKRHHLECIVTVILVDSVINNGDTIVRFVQAIQSLHAAVCIVVVAGVVQDQAVSGCSPIRALARSSPLTIVALRISKNKYTGSGNTDTGNRLFNTPHLP